MILLTKLLMSQKRPRDSPVHG